MDSLVINAAGVVLSHAEYQKNISDSQAVGTVLDHMKANTGKLQKAA
ncbi:hypothetical protein ACFL6B_00035 [Thermodesulfobacteriota bacterium]